jgi:hypothetical protein
MALGGKAFFTLTGDVSSAPRIEIARRRGCMEIANGEMHSAAVDSMRLEISPGWQPNQSVSCTNVVCRRARARLFAMGSE